MFLSRETGKFQAREINHLQHELEKGYWAGCHSAVNEIALHTYLANLASQKGFSEVNSTSRSCILSCTQQPGLPIKSILNEGPALERGPGLLLLLSVVRVRIQPGSFWTPAIAS